MANYLITIKNPEQLPLT